jgi:hypothetical protein
MVVSTKIAMQSSSSFRARDDDVIGRRGARPLVKVTTVPIGLQLRGAIRQLSPAPL